MEILGFVLGAINVVISAIVVIITKVNDRLADARSAIIEEVRSVYLQFGNAVAAAIPDTELETGGIPDPNFQGVEKAAKELERLHCRSVIDLIKLNRIKWVSDRVMRFVASIVVIVIISIAVGIFGVKENQFTLKVVFIIGIPAFFFICNFMFLVWIVEQMSYLKKVINEYEHSEY
jgi:hypothetical protein